MRPREEVPLVFRRLARHGCRSATVAVVALVALVAGGGAIAGGEATATSGNVAFSEVVHGTRDFDLPSESMSASGRVLHSASQAAKQLDVWGIDTEAVDSIDFSRQSAIVFLASYQPTGAYRARISKVVALGQRATVTVRVRYEGGETAAASATRPWVVVALKRSALARVRDVRIRLR
jgi:hypothetical protein